MENQVRELLREMADEVPPYLDVPSRLQPRARRRIAFNSIAGGLVAVGIALAMVTGLRSLGRDMRSTPGVDVPAPSVTPSPSPSVAPTLATVRFSERGCVYEGPGTAPAGQITIHVVNRVKERLYFALLSIEQGHSHDDLVRWTTGPNSARPPSWVTVVGDADVAASEGQSFGQLNFTTDVGPGLFGIVCATPKVPSSPILTPGSFSVPENT